jgi:diketogulonate reductase-like aldo/keto reductase
VAAVAGELETTPARVALNWVCRQPRISSPIIGARTVEQLEDNLGCLDVCLTDEHLARLSAISRPALGFPHHFIERSPTFRNNGLTINGEKADTNPMAMPESGSLY